MQIRTVPSLKRFLIYSLVVFTCVALGACTNSNRVGYKFLNWYLYWKVERFVDLDKEQKKTTKSAIKTFHSWHRQSQLPPYADFVQTFLQQVQAGPFTGADIHRQTDAAQRLVDASLQQLLAPAEQIARTLADRQVLEVLENIDEERQEFVQEYVDISDKKRLKKRQKDIRNFFEPWFGRFSKQQKRLTRDWAAALEPFEQLSASQQKQWRAEIKTLLDNRADVPALRQGLKGLMFYRTDDWQPELEAVLDRNQERTYQLVADLLNSLSAKQKNKLLRKLKKLREDLLYLAAQQG